MARYQQGIGVPETLGVQPTYWKEPTYNFPKTDTPRFNAGVSRKYGSTGRYVDTMPSRYKAAEFSTLNRLNRKIGRVTGFGAGNANLSGRNPFRGDTGDGTDPTDYGSPPTGFPSPTGEGFPVPPPPATRRATSLGLDAPPVAGTEVDYVTEMARSTPDLTSSPTGATFRDEPTNPFPMGDYDFTPSRVLDPSFMFGRRRGNRRNPI
jgi:hypothetical protein